MKILITGASKGLGAYIASAIPTADIFVRGSQLPTNYHKCYNLII